MNSIADRISHLKRAHGYLLFRAQHLCGTVFSHTGWQLDDAIYDFWALCVLEYDAAHEAAQHIRREAWGLAWTGANNMLVTLGLFEEDLEQAAQGDNAVALRKAVQAIVDYSTNVPSLMRSWARTFAETR